MKKRLESILLIALVSVSLASIITPSKASVTKTINLLKDPYFQDASKWTCEIYNWNEEEPISQEEVSEISDGLWHGLSDDTHNWDWSDSVAWVGWKPHHEGVILGDDLTCHPILDVYSNQKLDLTIRFRVPAIPTANEGIIDLRRAVQKTASVCVMVYFRVYVKDKFYPYNEYWLDYWHPDPWGDADMLCVEKFNRWYQDIYGNMQQTNEYDPVGNFYTRWTTHDEDFHYIRSGWIVENTEEFFTFSWDVKEAFDELAYWVTNDYEPSPNYIVLRGQVAGLGVSVETYLAEIEAYVDYITFTYTHPSGYENFQEEWKESDPLNRLTHTITRSTWTNMKRGDDKIYLSKFYGDNFFRNFVHKFDLRITDITVSTTRLWRGYVYTLSNVLDDWQGARKYELVMGIGIRSTGVQNKFDIELAYVYKNLYSDHDYSVALNVGTTYYLKLLKSGTSVSLYIYSNPERTVLIDSLFITLDTNYSFSYILCPQSGDWNSYPNYKFSGYVENLDLRFIT